MREVKRKLKKLFTFMMVFTMLLQSVVVYAGTDGMTEVIENAGYEVYLTDGNTTHNYQFANVMTYPSRVTVYIPYIIDKYADGEEYNYSNGWYSLKVSIEDKLSEIENAKNAGDTNAKETATMELASILRDVIQWTDFQTNYLDNVTDFDTAITDNIARQLQSALSGYTPKVYVSAQKEGSSLISYVIDKSYQSNDEITIGGSGITLKPIGIEPIFAPVETWYGTVSQLEESSQGSDFQLKPGSLIYAEGYEYYNYQNISAKYPMLYVEEEGYSQLILDSGAQSNQPDISGSSFLTGNTIVIAKVPDTYKNMVVEYWNVKKIGGASDFFGSPGPGNPYPSRNVSIDYGVTKRTERNNSNYFSKNNYYIELEPVYATIVAQNPTVSIDGYRLKLTSNDPKNSDGTISYPEMKDDVENYFYITTEENKTVAEVEEQELGGSIIFTEYNESSNRVLHEGTYYVFHKATCEGTEASGIERTQITIEAPKLTSPAIQIDPAEKKVSYVRPDTISPVGEGALDTNYSGEINNQKLIHVCTTNPDYDASGLPDSKGEGGNFSETDSISNGYNKVYAYTALTIPQSMDVAGLSEEYKAPKTYYSERAEKTIVDGLEAPRISGQGESFNQAALDYGGEISRNLKAGIRYIYCDYLDDVYKEFSSEEINNNNRCYGTESKEDTAAESINKTDGISVVYAIAVYKDPDNNSYYSEISRDYCKKRYDINNVQISIQNVENTNITLTSGGYSSVLKSYDTPQIYYKITDQATITEAELRIDSNRYTAPITRTRAGGYIHAMEVVTSKSDPTDNITLISKSGIVSQQIDSLAATITFDPNGGNFESGASATKQVKKGDTYGDFPAVERSGYTLTGWFDSRTGGNEINSRDQKQNDDDETLYAQWSENHYTIIFNANGGDGTMDPLVAGCDSEVRLSKNLFTNKDKKFLGWNTDSKAAFERWTDEEVITKPLSEKNGETVILYAIWKEPTKKPENKKPEDKTPPTNANPVHPMNPIKTVSQIIENVKTGDGMPFLKWGILFMVGTVLSAIAIVDHIRNKKDTRET